MITINDPQTEQELLEEAERTGQPVTEVARRAIIGGLAEWRAQRRATAARRLADEHRAQLNEQGLRRSPTPTQAEVEARLARLQQIQDEVGRLPILDLRSDEEIIGYDAYGLPSWFKRPEHEPSTVSSTAWM